MLLIATLLHNQEVGYYYNGSLSLQPGGKDVPVNIHNLDEYLKVCCSSVHLHSLAEY